MVSRFSCNQKSNYAALTLHEAEDRILGCISTNLPPLRTKIVKFADLPIGAVAVEEISASVGLPRRNTSLMDGFAYRPRRGDDNKTPKFQILSQTNTAGELSPKTSLAPGEAVYVTTGGLVPDGAAAVAPIEICSIDDGDDLVGVPIESHAVNIRPAGADVKIGEVVVSAGEVLNAANIGVCLSLGLSEIRVACAPRVAILSTGAELHKPGIETFDPTYQIWDTNAALLSRLVADNRGEVCRQDVIGDSADETHDYFASLSSNDQVDFVVTSGGVSMGARDWVKATLESLGTVHFGRLSVKPGSPTTFGIINRESCPLYVFALPGNPVSCAVAFQLLVLPLLRSFTKMHLNEKSALRDAYDEEKLPCVRTTLAHDFTPDPVRTEYHRCRVQTHPLTSQLVTTSTGLQLSSRLLSIAPANGLAILPPSTHIIPAGSSVLTVLTGLPLPAPTSPPFSSPPAPSPPAPSCSCGVNRSNSRQYKAAVVIVSDSRSAGTRSDVTGDKIINLLTTKFESFKNVEKKMVADVEAEIREAALGFSQNFDFLVFSGGTGLGASDVTARSLGPLFERQCSGLTHAMYAYGLGRTPLAALSSLSAGTIGKCMIVSIPGAPGAAGECIEALIPMIPHALESIH